MQRAVSFLFAGEVFSEAFDGFQDLVQVGGLRVDVDVAGGHFAAGLVLLQGGECERPIRRIVVLVELV